MCLQILFVTFSVKIFCQIFVELFFNSMLSIKEKNTKYNSAMYKGYLEWREVFVLICLKM